MKQLTASTVPLVMSVALTLVLATACDKASPPVSQSTSASSQPADNRGRATYDLQEKCARDAREWYKHAWEEGPPIRGLITDYTNHYNAKLGKCLLVLQVYSVGRTAHYTNRLMDVLENRDMGVVEWTEGKAPMTCTFNGRPCQSTDEWDALVKPYMED